MSFELLVGGYECEPVDDAPGSGVKGSRIFRNFAVEIR